MSAQTSFNDAAAPRRSGSPSSGSGVGEQLQLFAFSASVAATLFVLVTMRTTLHESDGLTLDARGFPQPWHWPSVALSSTTIVDAPALMLDACVYLAGVLALTIAARRQLRRALAERTWLSRSVIAVGALSVSIVGLDLWLSGQRGELWAGWQIVCRNLAWGW